MLLRAFNEPDYLQSITGLDELYEEGEAALEAIDWDEGSDEGSL
jgi:ubiquitin-like modifier-activating enzyme ATG7